jgi:hypothetical protein
VGIARCGPAGGAYAAGIDAFDDPLPIDARPAGELGVVVTGPVDGAP